MVRKNNSIFSHFYQVLTKSNMISRVVRLTMVPWVKMEEPREKAACQFWRRWKESFFSTAKNNTERRS